MKETERIADQLRRAFDGDTWSGPSLQDTLAGVTAAQAAAHPLAGVHSIGELVGHLTTWAATVAQRIEEQELTPPAGDDWPAFAAEPSEDAWQQARQALARAQERLLAATAALPDAGPGHRARGSARPGPGLRRVVLRAAARRRAALPLPRGPDCPAAQVSLSRFLSSP